jgi:hypothetical protein
VIERSWNTYTTDTATFSILGTCNSAAGTDARGYVLHYPGRRHTAEICSIIVKRHEVGLINTEFVNAHSPGTVRTKANEDCVISAVEDELCTISSLTV